MNLPLQTQVLIEQYLEKVRRDESITNLKPEDRAVYMNYLGQLELR